MTTAETKPYYTPQMYEVEARLGMPLRDAILKAFWECGTLDKVAEKLAVKRSTLSNWMLRLRLFTRKTLTTDPPGGNEAGKIPA